MRSSVGLFGLACGLIVIGLVGRYGYKTTDVETDAWIMAFLFGAIAAGGLFGHAVAVRLWAHSKPASLAMGLVSIVALLLNLSNSLGAIAGRADTVTTQRVEKNRKVRAAEAELKRLTDLRDAMPAFVPTDAEAVAAAKRAAEAAAKSREAECAKRGNNCRDREADERAANDRLAKATADKAATDRASKLESDAQAQRNRLAELGPVVTVNVQGAAITRLFRLPDSEAEFAATAQQFGVAVVVELIIMMALIAWEVLGHDKPAPTKEEPPLEVITPVVEPVAAPAAAAEPAPRKLPAPARPKLAVSNKRPVGAVLDFLHDGVEITAGPRTEMSAAFIGYAGWCKATGHRAMDVAEFVHAIEKACRQFGIRVKDEGELVYLMDMRLAQQVTEAV
jgi:hypothetical protein